MSINPILNIGSYAAFSGNTTPSISVNDMFGLQANNNAVMAMAQAQMAGVQTQLINLNSEILTQSFKANLPLTYSPPSASQSNLPGITSPTVPTPTFIIQPQTNLTQLANLTLNAANQANQATLFNYLI